MSAANGQDYGWLLSIALGPMDVYAELLALLPDAFFRLEKAQQQALFQEMLEAYSQGERELNKIIEAAGLEVCSDR